MYNHRYKVALVLASVAATPAFGGSLRVIHGFAQNADPGGGIIADHKGTLYGVLFYGGDPCGNEGCVYALSPPAWSGGRWTYSVIYRFHGEADGSGPQGQLALGPKRELYGYTGYGGVIYELAPQAGTSAWAFTKLAVLDSGFIPGAAEWPLIFNNGSLFGIASGGSETCPYVGCGSVFEVSPSPNGGWSVSTIVAFDGGSLGGSPTAIVGPDSAGGFYVANSYKNKVIYLLPNGTFSWKATQVTSFRGSGENLGCLVMGTNGNVYGLAEKNQYGAIFQIQPNAGGGTWTTTVLAEIDDHQFAPCPNINGPGGSLIGTVFGDQDFYYGDLFQLSPPAMQGGSWTYKILVKIGRSGRFGPINVVSGWNGDLYTPVNQAYGPPPAILEYAYPGAMP